MCLAQGHNTVKPVRLESTTPRSRVKHSTSEPLCSLYHTMICFGYELRKIIFNAFFCGNLYSRLSSALSSAYVIFSSLLQTKCPQIRVYSVCYCSAFKYMQQL